MLRARSTNGRPRRLVLAGLSAAATLLLVAFVTTISDAAGSPPSMEVLPHTTGLKYGQTVDVKGHHLPKGSGSVAVTICGLQDASGKTIAKPTADDCAGAPEIGKLVVVKSWPSNGEFDASYTLPASGQQFGTNKRVCDTKHHCAVVVADANPSKPAYYIATAIFFVDQQPAGGSTTPTTKPKPKPTTTTPTTKPKPTTTTTTPKPTTPTTTMPQHTTPTTKPTVSGSASGSGPGVSSKGSGSGSPSGAHVGVSIDLNGSFLVPPGGAPSLTAPTLPPQAAAALQQVCSGLSTAVKQAGGDPSALLAACGAIASGNGPQELKAVLQSPNLLCAEGASLWQSNPQVTAACNQAAAGLAPVTSQIGSALGGLLGS